ncbi:MAG: type IX secretion system PorP/SprF family membrane protein [Flavobacteriales bacterium]|jgi:type IX secretion system PorP/SprF family membrane protein
MMIQRLTYLFVFVLATSLGQAQDAQFTQFYAAPTYLNPAFAGTSIQSRISTNYRNQWPSIPNGFVTYNAAFDHFSPRINSGFGLLATHDRAGSGALASTSISLQYAYEIRITRNTFIRPALQFGYTNRSINFSRLVFPDQLVRGAETTLEEGIGRSVNFFDFGAGTLINSTNFWLGVSVHHLNQPTESLYGRLLATLPMKISAHGGYKFKIRKGYSKKKKTAVVAFNYKSQGFYDQLDLGAYYEFDPLTIGLWYRGLPALKSNGYGYANHDSFAIIVGWNQGPYKFGYSYDFTASQLSIGATAGSHEISLSYEWANKQNRRLAKRRIIPCAKF